MGQKLIQKIKDKFSQFKASAIFENLLSRKTFQILKLKVQLAQTFLTGISLKVYTWIKQSISDRFSKSLKSKKSSIIILTAAVTGLFIVIYWFLIVNPYIFKSNVKRTVIVYIHDNSDYQKVLTDFETEDIFRHIHSFDWLARKKKYPAQIKPGAYKLEKGWSNNQVLKVLLYGIQTPVKVTFSSVRFRENLAGRLSRCLEADSLSFLSALKNDSIAKVMGFTHETFPCIFIPNTYEFFWTTTPKKFIERMKKEYDTFWNTDRKNKAKQLGLTPPQVITLASIIQEESNMEDEKPRIAAVYLNRLRQDWFLQADPTVRFAMNDFSIKRIFNIYTSIDSPYNTYKYKGLPPGPINFPDIRSIDAVLNAPQCEDMYFCAREDFSGYHNFSKTLTEHLKYARLYQKALNKNRILH